MKPEKIDYERLGNDYIADNGGIEDAFRKIDMPVYVIYRHGVYKRYLSRSAAIDNLARIMTTHVFNKLDFPVRHEPAFDPHKNAWIIGGLTKEYFDCMARAKRRILRLLVKKREIDKWNADYGKWMEKYQASRDKLFSRKPY